jgi:hypothetical protein
MSPRQKSPERLRSLEKPILLEKIAHLELAQNALRAIIAIKNTKIFHLEELVGKLKEEVQMSQDIIDNLTHQLEAKP